MPLPKPSKTVSRRIKKPKPLLFPAPFVPPTIPKPSAELPRERRVRVICTDPDATDSSSDDDDDDDEEEAPVPLRLARKRLVHEICLPAADPATDFHESQLKAGACGENAIFASLSKVKARRKAPMIARKEVGVQGLEARSNAAMGSCVGNWAGTGEEGFSLFLSELFVLPDDEGTTAWGDGLGLPEDDGLTDVEDLELDSEVMTWINSLQRLV